MDWRPGYREQAPPAPLRPSVTCFWTRVADPGPQATAEVLPDACVDLIWRRGHGVFVAGPDTGPVPSAMPPETVLVGVRFAPGAGGPALGLPLSGLLNQRVDAADLGTGPAAALARVPADVPPETALRLLTDLAAGMVADGPADPLVTAAARLLGEPAVRAEAVAARLGVSERQLRRRCQAAVGYGPATLRRVLRFRRFLSWVDARGLSGARDLAAAAADFGYADQAHLTRESARLTGLPPAALARARRPVPAGRPAAR
jgi:AraC-like DNA-binding protein